MDAGQGFRVAVLDLGFPTVRGDVSDNPAHVGQLDTTRWFGARAVTISGTVIPSPSGSRTASLALLAPYMDPAARPVLTYQTDADAAPRQMTLRAADLSAPLNSLYVTTWSASWFAPLGLALGLNESSAVCGPSWLIQSGRAYPLTFNRTYPSFEPGDSVSVVPGGDYPTRPTFTLWGPAAGADITVVDETAGTRADLSLQAGYMVPAGRFVVIDCDARTITDDTGANVYGDALGPLTTWPTLVPGNLNTISFFATATAGSTRLYTTWFERWLI